jgi:chromosome segregation ATPase
LKDKNKKEEDDRQHAIEQSRLEIEALVKTKKGKAAELEKIQEQSQGLKESMNEYRAFCEAREEQMKLKVSRDEKRDSLKTKREETQKNLEEAQAKKEESLQRKRQAEQAMESAEKIRDSNEDLDKAIMQSKKELEMFTSQKQMLEKQIVETKQKLKSAKSDEDTSLQEVMASKQAVLDDIEFISKELETVRTHQFEQEQYRKSFVAITEAKIEDLRRVYENAVNRRKEFEQRRAELKEEHQAVYEERLANLEEERDRLQYQRDVYKEAISLIESAKTE